MTRCVSGGQESAPDEVGKPEPEQLQREVLRTAWQQWEVMVNDPSKGLKLPIITKREMHVLSVDQAKAFLKAALPTIYGTLSFVEIDADQNKVKAGKWKDEFDRPTPVSQ